jgi:hypothetical protein
MTQLYLRPSLLIFCWRSQRNFSSKADAVMIDLVLMLVSSLYHFEFLARVRTQPFDLQFSIVK